MKLWRSSARLKTVFWFDKQKILQIQDQKNYLFCWGATKSITKTWRVCVQKIKTMMEQNGTNLNWCSFSWSINFKINSHQVLNSSRRLILQEIIIWISGVQVYLLKISLLIQTFLTTNSNSLPSLPYSTELTTFKPVYLVLG